MKNLAGVQVQKIQQRGRFRSRKNFLIYVQMATPLRTPVHHSAQLMHEIFRLDRPLVPTGLVVRFLVHFHCWLYE